MKLYEITQQYNNLLAGEEIDIEALDAIEGAREEKLENIIGGMKSIEGEILAIDKELERLQAMKAIRKNKIESLKNYIAMNLDNAGIRILKVGTFRLGFRSSKSLVVESQDNIPQQFLKEKTTVSVDKNLLKKAIESGKKIEGVYIQIKDNLQIK